MTSATLATNCARPECGKPREVHPPDNTFDCRINEVPGCVHHTFVRTHITQEQAEEMLAILKAIRRMSFVMNEVVSQELSARIRKVVREAATR